MPTHSGMGASLPSITMSRFSSTVAVPSAIASMNHAIVREPTLASDICSGTASGVTIPPASSQRLLTVLPLVACRPVCASLSCRVVNIDRFIADHKPAWDRLAALTRRAGRNPGRLTTAELDELVMLYERVSTHLSLARTQLRNPALVGALTSLTARAGGVVYGHRARTWRAIGRFFTDTFPAAVWHARTFVVVATALFVLPAAGLAMWIGNSSAALDVVAPEAVREAYVSNDFEEYYSSRASGQFASEVTTNNIQVGVLAFAAGILLCVPTALVLVFNGINLGGALGMFIAAAQQPK